MIIDILSYNGPSSKKNDRLMATTRTVEKNINNGYFALH